MTCFKAPYRVREIGEMKMKYKVQQNIEGTWDVLKNGFVVFTASDEYEAQDHAQRLVEDDAWNAANRD